MNRRAVAGGYRLQLQVMWSNPDHLMMLMTTPVVAAVLVFLAGSTGREELVAHAVLGCGLMGLWGTALFVAGDIVDSDRWGEMLEPAMATPAGFGGAVVGRVLAVTTVGLPTFSESWLIARIVTGGAPTLQHPAVFLGALVAAAAAMSATALVMAAGFVLARSARVFQNSLSYPIYVLGGVVVPVALLPEWLRPVARLVFLSWASELLHATTEPGPIDDLPQRLAVLLVLGATSGLAGWLLLQRVLRHVRTQGTVTYA